MKNDNDDRDYEQEERELRMERAYRRALINQDPFYPLKLHEQDVLARFKLDEDD